MFTTTVSFGLPAHPQFAAETTIRAAASTDLRITVREDEHAVVPLDYAELAARIAREPRMGRRIDIAGAHPLTDPELWCDLDGASLGVTIGEPRGNFVSRQRRHRLLRPFRRSPTFELSAGDHARSHEQFDDLDITQLKVAES